MSTNPLILRTPITRKVQDLNGNAIQGATAYIYTVPGSAIATVYSTEMGAGTVSQPLTSGVDGTFAGWLEIGPYEMEITSIYGVVSSRYYSNHPQQSLLQGDSPDDNNFQIKDDGDTYPRLTIDAGGTIAFGSGSATEDTSLYRAGSGTLSVDGAFTIGTNLKVQGDDLAFFVKMNKEVF